VFFFQGEYYPKGYIGNISTMGNPLVWWGGFAAVIFILVQNLRKRTYDVEILSANDEEPMLSRKRIKSEKFGSGLLFVSIAALSEYLPWVLISRETFIYHYFATVPFLILLITFALKYGIEHYKYGKKFTYAYLAVVFILFVMFYPVLSGITIPIDYANFIRWLPSWPFY